MNSKGISPLIAAVMLIAFVMAIGGLFSEWSGQLATESTDRTSDDQSQILDCNSRTVEIDRIETGSNNEWVNVTVQADGGDLGNVTVTVFPEQKRQKVLLNSAGIIGRASFKVSQQQERVTASSSLCDSTIEKDIDY